MKTNEQNKVQMIVENPLNGQKVDLMPLFQYMEQARDWFSLPDAIAKPSHISKAIERIKESHITILSDVLECTDGLTLADRSLPDYTLALIETMKLEKVFKQMDAA